MTASWESIVSKVHVQLWTMVFGLKSFVTRLDIHLHVRVSQAPSITLNPKLSASAIVAGWLRGRCNQHGPHL